MKENDLFNLIYFNKQELNGEFEDLIEEVVQDKNKQEHPDNNSECSEKSLDEFKQEKKFKRFYNLAKEKGLNKYILLRIAYTILDHESKTKIFDKELFSEFLDLSDKTESFYAECKKNR